MSGVVRIARVRRLCRLWAALACLPFAAGADIMTVTLLGTGTPRPEAHRFGAAVLVEAGKQKLLFDAGRGVAQRLAEIYIPLQIADKLFVTHLHYDHLVGLPDLFLSGWQLGRRSPLRVWGPAGILAHTEHLLAAYHVDIDLRHRHTGQPKTGARFEAMEIKEGMIHEHGGLAVRAFAVDHGMVRPAFGYRIEYGGRVVVISGDTRRSGALIRNARKADLLVHEVAGASESLRANNERLRRILAYHTSVPGLIEVLNETRPRLALLTHVLAFGVSEEDILLQVQSAYQGDLRLGNDLLAVDVGRNMRVYQRPVF